MKQHYENLNKLIQESHEKVKYTIYLTKEQKAHLYKIKYEYKLSISTIALILKYHYALNPKTYKIAKEEQLYKTTNKKTSLKVIKTFEEESSKLINNILVMYIDKLDKNLLDPKEYEKHRNEIANEFQNTIEPLYNYNENYRQFYYFNKYANKSI